MVTKTKRSRIEETGRGRMDRSKKEEAVARMRRMIDTSEDDEEESGKNMTSRREKGEGSSMLSEETERRMVEVRGRVKDFTIKLNKVVLGRRQT